MRSLFTLLAKVMGLGVAYGGLSYLCDAISYLIQMIQWSDVNGYAPWCALMLACSGVCLYIARVLVFKTDWVADKVKLPMEESPRVAWDSTVMLPVGIRLAGLYFLLTAIPALADVIIGIPSASFIVKELDSAWHVRAMVHATPLALQATLSTGCVLKADAIADVMTRKRQIGWARVLTIILFVLAFLIFIGRNFAMQKFGNASSPPRIFKKL